MFAIAPTDLDWYKFLKNSQIHGKVNFWTPTPWGIKRLNSGDKFFFLLKSPIRKLGGYGTFDLYEEINEETAWQKYSLGNGCKTLKDMQSRLSRYREGNPINLNQYDKIGCIILNDVVYWDESDYKIPEEYNISFPNQVVKLKYFHTPDPFNLGNDKIIETKAKVPPTLEDELHEEMELLYKRAGEETNYWGNRYLQVVRRNGGLKTAKKMLHSKTSGQRAGLDRLLKAGRPELTLEYLVLKSKYRTLFTNEEINVAKERLKSFESDLNIQGNTGKNQENIEEDSFNESDYNKLIDDLENENNLDNTTVGTSRREQGLLRRYLFNNNEFSRCGICNHEYPVNMLVAAHIKKRASCTTKECLDYKNITMPMCKMGCDDLYEKGYIYVEDGKIIRNPEKESSITPKIRHYLVSIGDKKCNYYNQKTKRYFNWHRSKFKIDTIQYSEGDKIRHSEYGIGKITAISGQRNQKLTIIFEDQTTRNMMVNIAKLELIIDSE